MHSSSSPHAFPISATNIQPLCDSKLVQEATLPQGNWYTKHDFTHFGNRFWLWSPDHFSPGDTFTGHKTSIVTNEYVWCQECSECNPLIMNNNIQFWILINWSRNLWTTTAKRSVGLVYQSCVESHFKMHLIWIISYSRWRVEVITVTTMDSPEPSLLWRQPSAWLLNEVRVNIQPTL